MKLIYEPKGAAREYAALALNLYNGCTHRCIYCYNNGRFGKADGSFFKSAKPRRFKMSDLIADCRALIDQYGDQVPEVLISFIGDAYQPAERTLGKTRLIIRVLIDVGIPFTILTKSNLVFRDFDILAPYRDKFRLGMSIITDFDTDLRVWEPRAPSLAARLETLMSARQTGIRTWVSLEPVMKISGAVGLIRHWAHLVDEWHIGALNHMDPPKPVNWAEARFEIEKALKAVGAKYTFKKSLTEF